MLHQLLIMRVPRTGMRINKPPRWEMSGAALHSVRAEVRVPAPNISKHDCIEGRERQSGSQKMTVWFVNRQLGFVWKGWTKRAACPQGGRRQPDSLIWAAWDSGRRDLDWPKSTPRLHYSLSILCLPASPPSHLAACPSPSIQTTEFMLSSQHE